MGEGRLSPYTRESAFCTARRDESSAITGRTNRSAAARPICVYIEKLGLQSMNITSYEFATWASRSLTQSIIASHVFVPGICVLDSVLIALDWSSRRGSPQTKSIFFGIKWLRVEGVV